jgi:hypothetical protein
MLKRIQTRTQEQAAPFPDARRTRGKGKQRLHIVLLRQCLAGRELEALPAHAGELTESTTRPGFFAAVHESAFGTKRIYRAELCPLLGVKRTYTFDPERALTSVD